MVMFQDKGKVVEESPEQESVAVSYENMVSSAETTSSSLVLKTLEDLKKKMLCLRKG